MSINKSTIITNNNKLDEKINIKENELNKSLMLNKNRGNNLLNNKKETQDNKNNNNN